MSDESIRKTTEQKAVQQRANEQVVGEDLLSSENKQKPEEIEDLNIIGEVNNDVPGDPQMSSLVMPNQVGDLEVGDVKIDGVNVVENNSLDINTDYDLATGNTQAQAQAQVQQTGAVTSTNTSTNTTSIDLKPSGPITQTRNLSEEVPESVPAAEATVQDAENTEELTEEEEETTAKSEEVPESVPAAEAIEELELAEEATAQDAENTEELTEEEEETIAKDEDDEDLISEVAAAPVEATVLAPTIEVEDLVLKGTKGDDILTGSTGDDIIKARKGDDVLSGGGGNDILKGGKGDDVLDGNSGDDVLKAGKGDDVLSGGTGDDVLKAGKGDDVLSGGAGDDILRGGRGNDTLDGGAGNDEAWGGRGDDLFVFGEGHGADVFHGGGGNWSDSIMLESSDHNVQITEVGDNSWTIVIDDHVAQLTADHAGTIENNALEFDSETSGVITMGDGSTLNFDGVEHINW